MSYTGSHPHNFIPSSTAAIPMNQDDRRAVRPLGDDGSAASSKQVHAANLEAQVRVLEQEVHLLRTGLAQNERLRQASTPGSPPRRVHFGPSSVVPIPRVTPSSAASPADLGSTRRPSMTSSKQPRRQSSPSTAVRSNGGRPSLAFGQRVDPSMSRTAHTAAAGSTHTSNRQPVTRATWSEDSSQEKAQNAEVEYLSSSAAAATAQALPTAANTTYVPLSPAPASLRGSNTAGIPLQGAAAGATVVSAVEGVSPLPSSSPGATVWASADPSLLRRRAAAAVANSANSAHSHVDIISSYPFRTSSAPPLTPANAASVAPAPILVTMSSDRLPSNALQPNASTSATSSVPASAAAAAEGNTRPLEGVKNTTEGITQPNSISAVAASSVATTSETSTTVPAAVASTQHTSEPQTRASPSIANLSSSPSTRVDASVEEMTRQIVELRDTLDQREALLHRVLLELHDCGSTAGRTSTTLSPARHGAPDDKEEQRRRTLRLLTQELLAAQTQLSHAKVSYRLVQEELQRQQQIPLATAPAVCDAAPSLPLPPPPPPPPPPPATSELQTQLDAALRKVKAWEDWYASTTPAEAGSTSGEAVASATSAPSKSADKNNNDSSANAEKRRKKKRHSAEDEEKNASHGHRRRGGQDSSRSCCCPHCGEALTGASPCAFPSAAPSFAGYFPSFDTSRAPAAATPALTSAYALDDALYSRYASHGYPESFLEPFTKAPSSSAVAADTPPPQLQAHASTPPREPTRASRAVPAASPGASRNAMQSSRGAAPAHYGTWEGEVGCDRRRGLHGVLAPPSTSSYYCDDLEHAKMQAYCKQQYVTQMAREAAVRELAEAERQVAEERLAVRQRQRLSCTPPSPPLLPLLRKQAAQGHQLLEEQQQRAAPPREKPWMTDRTRQEG
ncbi:hypothetical protein ABB37_02644 [Leptomonas pyrrhocoris]|uniref:Uncharacterized protein n=1 Tax=Leptomonas pyrrhocoris TaxID=157538 RepID=A0A0N0DXE4_LEPPY|nr:hypothetical protein ABB37_02644 [Leptomonas pyrrhocoris]KPA82885.1 hypothetical protein ABB37_02644 [Leptomonas pyrrhocoris]|eukprot:XP_015661324.1 hypothetical protein ABB37_02644 [Leptomonas pyrrhocoris]